MGYPCGRCRPGSARPAVFSILSSLFVFVLAAADRVSAQGTETTPRTSAADATAAAPSRAPLPNRANDALPAWLRVRADFRERMESVHGAAFTGARDDAYWLSRLRFNATVQPSRHLSAQVQIQDARVAGKQVGPGGVPFSAPVDLRVAFIDAGATTTPVTMRVGRQELAFGEQRLVGHAGWANAARAFDAARLTLRGRGLQIDLFAASPVRSIPDAWDRSGAGHGFYGAYVSTTSLLPEATIEPYFFWRNDRAVATERSGTGDLRLATSGVRWNGPLPAGFDYGVEVAAQAGSVGADVTRAWASHVQLRTPAFGPALRVAAEYNYATGDDDPADGRRGTFDQLFPTPHDKYGLADQVGWRNIHHLRAGVDIRRVTGVPITMAWNTWWLASARDALYSAAGAPVARIPAGAPDRHVGQEIDVQASRALTPHLQLAGGYAYIHPGAFLKAATPGASYSSAFLMVTYVFLADR